MTTDERDTMHIAQCQICTLGSAMKHCSACPFRLGLVAKLDDVLLPLSAQVDSVYMQADLDWRDLRRTEADARY